ncbi:MAG TPA: DUF2203 domain-containing protein [Gemmataceae bacterium]|nr:DUF2203 domain-containing protein [Gemmataceae bacterium]
MPDRPRGKKFFTVAEANATLPLLRAILRDITSLATDLRERYQRLKELSEKEPALTAPEREEAEQITAELERGQERMEEYEQELRNLGVELKDYLIGLIDFPCRMGDREIYLCWKLDEAEVAHWHELDAGFAGRQELKPVLSRICT